MREECRAGAVRTILSADFWTFERLTKWNGHITISAYVKAAHEHRRWNGMLYIILAPRLIAH